MGGVSSIQVFLDFWNFFNFAKPLIRVNLPKFDRVHTTVD